MELVFYKSFAALLIFLVSIATIIYPLRKKSVLEQGETAEIGEALASGIFLGAALFHMLPDAINAFSIYYPDLHYPLAEVICVTGFLLLLLLERLSYNQATHEHHTHTAATTTSCHMDSKNPVLFLMTLTLFIHALIEGMALGVGTFSEAFMIFIAILAHKGSESYALCILYIQHHVPMRRIIWTMVIFALMSPIGIALGAMLNFVAIEKQGELAAAFFNAFAAGSFLYISTLHHVHFHEHAREIRSMIEFASLTLGAAIMAAIAFWV